MNPIWGQDFRRDGSLYRESRKFIKVLGVTPSLKRSRLSFVNEIIVLLRYILIFSSDRVCEDLKTWSSLYIISRTKISFRTLFYRIYQKKKRKRVYTRRNVLDPFPSRIYVVDAKSTEWHRSLALKSHSLLLATRWIIIRIKIRIARYIFFFVNVITSHSNTQIHIHKYIYNAEWTSHLAMSRLTN